MIFPSGNQKSSDFAMKRRNRRGKSGIPRGHGSKFDEWFAASTQPALPRDVLGARSRCRKTVFSTGQLSAATTK